MRAMQRTSLQSFRLAALAHAGQTRLVFHLAALGYLLSSREVEMLAALRARDASLRFPGRVAVVVGATAGIGRAVAVRLAEADYRVVVVGRDAARGAEVVAECAAASQQAHEFIACDASRLAAVRACSTTIAQRFPVVDALVLSQGIATTAGRTETEEGLDVKLALHYFGRVEFVRCLLPQLRASESGRVLSVLSAGVHSTYAHWSDDFELRNHYGLKAAADSAGFYTDAALHSLSLEASNSAVTFVHAAPGFVATSWGTELPWAARCLVRGLQHFAMPAAECAEYLCDTLLTPRTAGGLVLVGPKGKAAAPTPQHEAAREGIWRQTRALLDSVK